MNESLKKHRKEMTKIYGIVMGKESLARKIIEATRPEPDEPKVKRDERYEIPKLIVHPKGVRTKDDRKAINLMSKSGWPFLIVERSNEVWGTKPGDRDYETIPRILYGRGIFNGCRQIETFIEFFKFDGN